MPFLAQVCNAFLQFRQVVLSLCQVAFQKRVLVRLTVELGAENQRPEPALARDRFAAPYNLRKLRR